MKLRITIGFKIAFIFAQFFVLSLTSIILFVIASNRESVSGHFMTAATNLVGARSDQLSGLVDKFQAQLDMIVNRPEAQSGEPGAIESLLESIKGNLADEIAGVLYCWPDGSSLTDSGARSNLSERDYFRAIVQDGKDSVVGSAVISKSLGIPIVVVAQAVRTPDGELKGLVGLQFKMETLSAIAGKISAGRTGYGWIIDETGQVIAHPDAGAIMSLNVTTADEKGYSGLSAAGARFLAEEAGAARWSDPDGIQQITFWTHLGDETKWIMGVSVPEEQLFEAASALANLLLLLLAVGITAGIIVSVLIGRTIAVPIRRVAVAFRGLAQGDADLTVVLGAKTRDEVGDLVRDFNLFIAKLRDIVVTLKAAQTELSTVATDLSAASLLTEQAAGEITDRMERIGTRVVNQMDGVNQASTAVTEIAQNIESLDRMIADQAAGIVQASASIEEMVGNITSMSNSVERMGQEFGDIAQSSEAGFTAQEAAGERVAQVTEQSRALVEANEAISTIASQTNLLAMNAAIEAAHAGEAGKGFSVVADEIRRLAETSSEQSRTIGEELHRVEEVISEVIEASATSRDSFTDLGSRIKGTEGLVREIRAAMLEQREGSRQILEALRMMNEVTHQVRSGSEEMSAGNKAILQETEELKIASSAIRDEVVAAAAGVDAINEGAGRVARAAEATTATIARMDDSIGRFKV